MNKHHKSVIFKSSSGGGGNGASLKQASSGLKTIPASTNASDTINVSTNFTAGSTVIICVTGFNDNNTTSTFSGVTVSGTAAVEDSGKQHAGLGFNYRIGIWRATNVTGGSTAIVFNWTGGIGSNHQLSCSVEEWLGFNASPVDAVPTPVQTTGTTQAITSAATAQAHEIVYAACNTTNADCAGLAGPTAGYTQTFIDNGGTGTAGVAGYKVLNAIGAQTANFATTGSVESDAVMVTYKTA